MTLREKMRTKRRGMAAAAADDTPSATVTPIRDEGIAAGDLHLVLPVAQTILRSFTSEKHLMSYRRMIYTINKQAQFRYRTIRAEDEMWGLVIWRMK